MNTCVFQQYHRDITNPSKENSELGCTINRGDPQVFLHDLKHTAASSSQNMDYLEIMLVIISKDDIDILDFAGWKI